MEIRRAIMELEKRVDKQELYEETAISSWLGDGVTTGWVAVL